MNTLTKFIIIIACALSLASCYHPDIQQGNNLSAKQVKQIKLGMSQTQIIQLLGTPVMQDTYNPNQLIYIYTNLPNHGDLTEKKMLLNFRNDKLVKIDGGSSFGA